MHYRKIPKISPAGLIFFKGPFRGAFVLREICVSKSIGLPYSWKEFTIFALFKFVFEGNF